MAWGSTAFVAVAGWSGVCSWLTVTVVRVVAVSVFTLAASSEGLAVASVAGVASTTFVSTLAVVVALVSRVAVLSAVASSARAGLARAQEDDVWTSVQRN